MVRTQGSADYFSRGQAEEEAMLEITRKGEAVCAISIPTCGPNDVPSIGRKLTEAKHHRKGWVEVGGRTRQTWEANALELACKTEMKVI